MNYTEIILGILADGKARTVPQLVAESGLELAHVWGVLCTLKKSGAVLPLEKPYQVTELGMKKLRRSMALSARREEQAARLMSRGTALVERSKALEAAWRWA